MKELHRAAEYQNTDAVQNMEVQLKIKIYLINSPAEPAPTMT